MYKAICCFCFLFCQFVGGQLAAQEIKILSNKIIETRVLSNYQDAISFADSLIEVYEKEPFMVSANGGETYWDGLGSIRNVYEKALQFKSNDQHAILQLAKIYDQLNTRSNLEKNDQFKKLVARADSFYNQKQYDKATEVYQKALQLKPEDKYCLDKIEEIKRSKVKN